MIISIDWVEKLVLSTASITDIVAFKDAIRDLEDDATGMLYPPVITYKRLDLGGGAFFHAVDCINGYRIKFTASGSYQIIGNIGAEIVADAGVFVDRTKSAAFATVAGSGSSSAPTAAQVADAVLQRVVEGGLSLEQVLRVLLAPVAGRATGVGTSMETYLSQDGATARVVATFDAAGNRMSVAITP